MSSMGEACSAVNPKIKASVIVDFKRNTSCYDEKLVVETITLVGVL